MEEEQQYLDNRIHGSHRNLKNTQRYLSCNYGLRENPKKKTQESPESMKKIQFRCEECGKVFRYEKCLWNHQAGMHSPTNQNQSERVYELEEPMKSLCISFSLVKKKKRSRVIRYKKTPLSCSFTTFLESRSVSAGYDEELEVAECLILLSKSSPKFDGLKLVGEAMDDANPETPIGCLSFKKPRKDGEFDSGFFSNEQKLMEERSSSYETPKEKARFLGAMECYDSDAECDKRNSEHQCKLCKKIFSSYQALGGHQTYHRSGKIRNKRNCREESVEEEEPEPVTVTVTREKKRHECSICSRSFDSVHALGGHKRSHGKRQHSKTEDGDDEDLGFLSVVPVTLGDEFY